MNDSGFVAGTLVHTDKGLVPIQELKIGDKILSKPEGGVGDIEYKPVLSTFKSVEKKRVFKVEYFNETADARGEEGRNYILCTNNHLFWVKRNPEDLEGEWLSAERLPPGYLTSAHGDTIALDDYAFIPVRTLPNYPEGCAYIQNIQDKDLWETDGLVQFLQFSDNGYQYVSLADTKEEFKQKIKTLNWETSDAKLLINQKASFLIDPELYKTLNIRISQDEDSTMHTVERFVESVYAPLVVEGKVIQENSIADMKLVNKAIENIKKYGNATGLTEESLHEQMENYYDACPNPYEDHVYNIEVADHHTYFVGHDTVWVQDSKLTSYSSN